MEQLQLILTDLDNKAITKHQAYDLILVLFAVSNRRKLLIDYELKLWINPTKEQIEIAEKIVDIYLSN